MKKVTLLIAANEARGLLMYRTERDLAMNMTLNAMLTALGVGILIIMWQIGFFRGLTKRHLAYIMLAVMIAVVAGYCYGTLGNR